MDSNAHRIQRQTIELAWASDIDPTRLQHDLQRFVSRQLLPLMEPLLDQVAGANRLLRFDRIVLDLGDISRADWQGEFCDRFLAELRQSLIRGPRSALPEDVVEVDVQEDELLLRQFLFLLHHGRLPAWSSKQEAGLLDRAPSRFSRVEWREVSAVVKRDHRALLRLLRICTSDHLARFFEAVYGLTDVDRVVAFFTPVSTGHPLSSLWNSYCWSVLCRIAADQRAAFAAAQLQELLLVAEIVRRRSAGEASEAGWRGIRSDGRGAVAALPQPWRSWLPEPGDVPDPADITEPEPQRLIARLLLGTSLQDLRRTPAGQQGTRRTAAAATIEASPAAHAGNPPEKVERPGANTGRGASLTVSAAGAVIAHPFLAELFASQGLTEEGQFVDELSRHVALGLVTYFAFGAVEVAEYDLLLPKLLCAMPWDCVPLDAVIDRDQQAACDELLEAVLDHWTALKSKSVDFLRQQFFWREGTIDEVDDGWRLKIEARAQDILLAKLPWGTGVIKLPWMDRTLFVNWEG